MKETIDILQFFGVNKPLFVMSGLACDNTKRFGLFLACPFILLSFSALPSFRASALLFFLRG
jgi:hypothetical protein